VLGRGGYEEKETKKDRSVPYSWRKGNERVGGVMHGGDFRGMKKGEVVLEYTEKKTSRKKDQPKKNNNWMKILSGVEKGRKKKPIQRGQQKRKKEIPASPTPRPRERERGKRSLRGKEGPAKERGESLEKTENHLRKKKKLVKGQIKVVSPSKRKKTGSCLTTHPPKPPPSRGGEVIRESRVRQAKGLQT